VISQRKDALQCAHDHRDTHSTDIDTKDHLMKILANDGIDSTGKKALEALGCTVVTEKVAQENLAAAINAEGYDGLLVRSATTARKD
jgi:hypothetical protein